MILPSPPYFVCGQAVKLTQMALALGRLSGPPKDEPVDGDQRRKIRLALGQFSRNYRSAKQIATKMS